jgi:predicted PurR-regulated permease PerM
LISLIAAIAATIALSIVKIPFAIPLGILVGVLDLLPLVGATLAAVIVVVVCLFNSTTAALVMAGFFLLYQQLENNILQPLVYGRTVQLSPLMVLMSAIIGVALGGILGALVAIPVAACLQIVIRDYLQNHF